MSKLTPECCKNCKFGQKAKTNFAEESLECRRYPPTRSGNQQRPETHPFPIVGIACWCGEYKLRTGE